MSKNRADLGAGFTLIEVVIALAIAGLGLGLLLAAAGTGLGNSTASYQYVEAARRAQSRLATLGTIVPLRAGDRMGEDGGGYSWRIRISEPIIHTGAVAPGHAPVGLFRVDVTIQWRSGASERSFSLSSQRLGAITAGNG